MQYRINPKNGDRLSALGFGCMRLPRDEKAAEMHIRHAIAQGVNYFDTAYLYPGSEMTLGKILSKDGLRSRVSLATKLPHQLARKPEDLDKYLHIQLERLQTDRIEYYLLHMLSDMDGWQRLVDMGICDWIARQKAAGTILNIGFSFHGAQTAFRSLVDAYAWDFCMIQYNYLDENNQAGKGGLLYAAQKGLPVIVMEPLRGGTLAGGLPPSAASVFRQAHKQRTPADWGLRWVLNHPEVTCVLSGMSTKEMVDENIQTACDAKADALSPQELALYAQARAAIQATTKVGCTGCGYCVPCPQGVDIPMCFACYNDTALKGRLQSMYWYLAMTKGHGASQCVRCGLCVSHCPQAIPIPTALHEAAKVLEGFPFRPMRFIVSRFMRS